MEMFLLGVLKPVLNNHYLGGLRLTVTCALGYRESRLEDPLGFIQFMYLKFLIMLNET